MKECGEIRELIPFYVEGELSKDEINIVKGHIEACEECRAEYEETKEMLSMLKGVEDIELPEGFSEDLHKKLSKESGVNRKVIRFIKSKYFKTLSTVAACLIIFIAVRGMLDKNRFDFRDKASGNDEKMLTMQEQAVETKSIEDITKYGNEGSVEKMAVDEDVCANLGDKPEKSAVNGSDAGIVDVIINLKADNPDREYMKIAKYVNEQEKENESHIKSDEDDAGSFSQKSNTYSLRIRNDMYAEFENYLNSNYASIEIIPVSKEKSNLDIDEYNRQLENIEKQINEINKKEDSDPEKIEGLNKQKDMILSNIRELEAEIQYTNIELTIVK